MLERNGSTERLLAAPENTDSSLYTISPGHCMSAVPDWLKSMKGCKAGWRRAAAGHHPARWPRGRPGSRR
jgi:hypothetical protein